MAYTNIRKSGIQAITLREDDELIDVNISDNNDNIMLITKKGQGISSVKQMSVKQDVQQWVLEVLN